MQNQYIDLPINIQDAPNHLLQKITPSPVPSDPIVAATEILVKLQELIKGSQEQLYIYCQTVMVATEAQHFINSPWPTPSSLQEHNDTEYKAGAQNIYSQFMLRNSLDCLKEDNEEKWLDLVDLSWETYTSIFQLEAGRVDFHPMLVWNYFENFLSHYVIYHNQKSKIEDKEKLNSQWFSKDKVQQIFTKLRKSLPQNISSNYNCQQIFAYYSIVAEIVIQTNDENYKRALTLVQKISLRETLAFSKGCGSLLTLLLNISFSYFMEGQYTKSMKLSQTIVTFFQKYRKHFNKSLSEKPLTKVHEKNICLLCLNYIFLQEKPKGPIMDIFKNTIFKLKDKQNERVSDCFFKMKQNDTKTYMKLISIIRAGFLQKNIDQHMLQKFKKIQQITIFTIIQNYKRIQLKKMAKLLQISEEQVKKQINNIEKIGQGTSNWDRTVMNPLLTQRKKVNVEIVQNHVVFESKNEDQAQLSREWERCREQINWLSEKVNKL